MASTEEAVGPGPKPKLVLAKRVIINCLRDCLGIPAIPRNSINY